MNTRTHETDALLSTSPVRTCDLLDRTSTGGDVVQWLDHSGLWTAVPSPALLLEDLAATLPIRTSPQYPNRPNRNGWYAWRGEKHVWFESGLEAETLLSLEQRGIVAEIAPQPMRLLFRDGSACTSHVPDYFAVLSDGRQVLIDVKPRSRMSPRAVEQFVETARVCQVVGWEHLVEHEESEGRRRNLASLREYRHRRCHPSAVDIDRALDIFAAGRSVGEARPMLNLRHPNAAMPTIAHLIWHRFLDLSWDCPLTLDTVLTTTTGGSACCTEA